MVPGMTQQQIVAIEDAMQRQQVADLVAQLRASAGEAAAGDPTAAAADAVAQPGYPGAQPTDFQNQLAV
jgi:hypothetical protein